MIRLPFNGQEQQAGWSGFKRRTAQMCISTLCHLSTQRKCQAFDYFKAYEAMATSKYGSKIANLRWDLDRECFSNDLHNSGEDEGDVAGL